MGVYLVSVDSSSRESAASVISGLGKFVPLDEGTWLLATRDFTEDVCRMLAEQLPQGGQLFVYPFQPPHDCRVSDGHPATGFLKENRLIAE